MATKRHYSSPAIKKLYGRSAGLCNLCGNSVVRNLEISEIAHIVGVGSGESSPRSSEKTLNGCGINDYENLILLCPNCHRMVDSKEYKDKYTTAVLWKIKNEFEKDVQKSLEKNNGIPQFLQCFFYFSKFVDIPKMLGDLPKRYMADFHEIGDYFHNTEIDHPGIWPFHDKNLYDLFLRFLTNYNSLYSSLQERIFYPYEAGDKYPYFILNQSVPHEERQNIFDKVHKYYSEIIQDWRDINSYVNRYYPTVDLTKRRAFD